MNDADTAWGAFVAATKYFDDAPDWVWENEIVQRSIRAGNWGTYGTQDNGAPGLLGVTVTGPDGSQYTFEYHGLMGCMIQ